MSGERDTPGNSRASLPSFQAAPYASRMNALRAFLAVFLTILAAYTGVVIARDGLGLLPVFFGDIAAVGWPGQFNLDFLGFLILSAAWTAWRHRFSAWGLALGALAFFFGMGFVCAYVLIAAGRARGDVAHLLLGPSRVSETPRARS